MAPKIKSKPPKQSKVTPDPPSDDSQELHENDPPENNPGNSQGLETGGEKNSQGLETGGEKNSQALETGGENSSPHKTGGSKPGPSKKSLQGRRKRCVLNVSTTVYNIEQKINHFLKLQHERRKEMYQEYSHQFLTLVVMWNIDVHQIKKQTENLSNILEEQEKLYQQFQVIHKQKIEEFKELCSRHLKNLRAIKSCRRKAIIEEARKQMDILERKLTAETVKLQEENPDVRSPLLSLLFS